MTLLILFSLFYFSILEWQTLPEIREDSIKIYLNIFAKIAVGLL